MTTIVQSTFFETEILFCFLLLCQQICFVADFSVNNTWVYCYHFFIILLLCCKFYLQEMLPAKEPQAFQEIKLNEVILSVAICHPRTVGEAVCEMIYSNSLHCL